MGAEKLRDTIKQIVKEYLDNENPSDLVYATYTGAELKIDSKPEAIPLDMVDVPVHLQTVTGLLSCELTSGFEIVAKDGNNQDVDVQSIKLTNVPVTIQTGLPAGSRVAVVQKKGSQRFSIIDRV